MPKRFVKLMTVDACYNYNDYCLIQCLVSAERRCDGLAVFIKEENKRLGGPFEADVFSNMTLDECQAMCVRAEK